MQLTMEDCSPREFRRKIGVLWKNAGGTQIKFKQSSNGTSRQLPSQGKLLPGWMRGQYLPGRQLLNRRNKLASCIRRNGIQGDKSITYTWVNFGNLQGRRLWLHLLVAEGIKFRKVCESSREKKKKNRSNLRGSIQHRTTTNNRLEDCLFNPAKSETNLQ